MIVAAFIALTAGAVHNAFGLPDQRRDRAMSTMTSTPSTQRLRADQKPLRATSLGPLLRTSACYKLAVRCPAG
jgi:hypothetical protein